MNNVKYDLHVSLQPQLYEGYMAHYWNVTQTNVDGTFTIKDGWSSHYGAAIRAANNYVIDARLVK